MNLLCYMLIILESLANPCPPGDIIHGYASQYSPYVMETTISIRQGFNQLPPHVQYYDAYIAVLDCRLIGDEAWIKRSNQREWQLALIADCANKHHLDTLALFNVDGVILEVDYPTAVDWGIVGQGGVKVDCIGCQP